MSQNHSFHFSAGSGHVPVTQPRSDYTQSTAPVPPQQAAFQQAPQPPAMDISVLEGISPEQLAAIARMFQSGALQMPPPTPPVPTQLPNPHQRASAVTESSSILPTSQSQPPPKVAENGMDTEEGEVNESESDNTPASSREFLRPPPTGPKNRSVSPREIKRRKQSPRPPLQPAAGSNQFQVRQSPSSHATAVANGGRAVAKNEAAKAFVLEMFKAGYAYNDILPEVRNPKSLIRMFKELDLPIDSALGNEHLTKPKPTTAANSHPQAPIVATTSDEDARKASLVRPPAPVKAAPKDRKTYLAELQAVRSKKTDTDVKPERSDYLARLEAARIKKVEPAATKPGENQVPSQNGQTPTISASGLVTRASKSADSKVDVKANDQSNLSSKAAKNELLKQKLQALKAQQAAKKAHKAASSPAPTPTTTASALQATAPPHGNGLGAGLADIPSYVAQTQAPPSLQTLQRDVQVPPTGEPMSSPIPETPSRLFSNLPGLFMFGSRPQQYATSQTLPSMPVVQPPAQALQASNNMQLNNLAQGGERMQAVAGSAPVSSQRKRPVASDFDDVSHRPNAVKRLFGQSRNASEDESLVIEVSDAEDEDDDMDPEPEPVPVPGQYPKSGLQTKSFRDVAPLRDFPPKQTFQTSSPGTPGGITYEQKMREIEEFKRKIAEKEKRQKTNGKVPTHGDLSTSASHLEEANGRPAMKQSSPPHESSTPAYEPSAPDPSVHTMPEASAVIRSRSVSTAEPLSPSQPNRQQEKERLRQRLLELEHEESEDEDVDDDHAEDPEVHEYGSDPQPELTMFGALPTTSESPPAHLQEQAMEPEDLSRNGNDRAQASEDGELSDDSVSNFYDVQETQHVQLQEESTLPNDSNGYAEPTPPSTVSDTEAVAASGVRVDTLSSPPAADRQSAEFQDDDIPLKSEAAVQLTNEENVVDMESIELPDKLEEPPRTIIKDLVSDSSPTDDPLEDGELDDDLQSYPEQSAEPTETELEVDQSISNPTPTETRDVIMADDDLAPEIQPTLEEESTIPNLVPSESMHHFTPYRSPLQGFRDYRYHPEYLTEVDGGHRSATYSYNIDPQQSFCPYETAGGTCNGAACQFQHFKSLFVSDTELLKMMGTKHIPANTPDEYKRWNEGLGQVVRELRSTNLGKDANAIAARIAQFRRDFIGDPTKILNLP